MQLQTHVDRVQDQLVAAAALGDDRTRAVAAALGPAAAAAVRLALLDALSAAADEITAALLDTLRYGSGQVRAGHVHGGVHLRSGTGDATFDEIGGDLRCGGGSGSLHVGVAHGRVHARTGAGAAHLDAVHGDVDLFTGSGPMSIGLPAGVTARLDVATGSGTVRPDLPVEDAPSSTAHPITVRARTASGDVRLSRAAA